MDPFAVLAAVLVLATLFFAVGDVSGRTERAFAGYFRGVKPDPWPHGVQEEDDSTPWARRARQSPPAPDPTVATQPVRGSVRAR